MGKSGLSNLTARVLALLAVAAMAAALTVSCGGPASTEPSETLPASSGTPSETSPTPPGPSEIPPEPSDVAPAGPTAAPLPPGEPGPGPDLEQGMLSDYKIFLQVEGLPGESTDAEHEDWIDVSSYSHGVALPAGSISSGSTRTTTRAELEDFVVVKSLDKSSPKLALYCCQGQHIPSVRVELCRASGDRQKFMEYLMEDVIVTSVQTSGDALSGEAVPVEEVSFRYGKITWTYTEFDPVTGKAKGDVSSEWNCIEYTG